MHCHWLGRALVALACSVACSISAAPGNLDPAFGAGGIVRIQSDLPASTRILASARQPDGRIVVAGDALEANSTLRKAVVGRLNADGSVDPSFGTGGWITVAHPQGLEWDGRAVALAIAGGRIWVAFDWHGWLGVSRWLEDGSPDPAFVGNSYPGITQIAASSITAVAAAGDLSFAVLTSVPMVHRFDANGWDLGNTYVGEFGRAQTLLQRPDGSIFVGGMGFGPSGLTDFLVMKLTAGSPDPSFGQNGSITVDFAGFNDAAYVLMDDGARIVAVGAAGMNWDPTGQGGSAGLGLARFDATTGALDAGFGSAGKLSMNVVVDDPLSFYQAAVPSAAAFLDSAGGIAVAGSIRDLNTDRSRGFVARVDSNGAGPSPGFGIAGVAILPIADYSDTLFGLGLTGAEMVAVGSRGEDVSGRSHVLRRRLGAIDGAEVGAAITSQGISAVTSMVRRAALAADGTFVTVGRVGDFTRVMRFLPGGTPDPGFGTQGKVDFNDAEPGRRSRGGALALQPDGAIIAASTNRQEYFGSLYTHWSIKRLTASGATDMTFGGGHADLLDMGGDVLLADVQADGKVVIGGVFIPGGSGSSIQVARLNPDGTLDPSYGVGGIARANLQEVATAMALQPDGKILVTSGASTVRLTSSGEMDYGGWEWSLHQSVGQPPHALHVQRDGRVVVSGRCQYQDSACLVRLSAAGREEMIAFPPPDGAHLTALASLHDGYIVGAGDHQLDHPIVMRLTTDGYPDGGFGDSYGYAIVGSVSGEGWQGRIDDHGSALLHSYSVSPTEGEHVLFVKLLGVDMTPDAFSFAPVTNAPLGQMIGSFVYITGIDYPAPVSIAGGEYAVNCGFPYTSVPGTVPPGGGICVRHQTSSTAGTTTTTTLTVGGVSAQFVSTTGLPPETLLVSAPPAVTASTTAVFSFTSSDPAATFRCKLDADSERPCGSPLTLNSLAEGGHQLTVLATNQFGNDPTPVVHAWRIDITAPDTTITDGPSGNNNPNTTSFTFASNESAVTFECSLDDAAYAPCGATQTYQLATGQHSLLVRARDAAGNVDATPASRVWRSHP